MHELHPIDRASMRDEIAQRIAPNLITAIGSKPQMQGLPYDHLFKYVAEASYAFADAMLEARKPKQQKEPIS